MSRRDSFLPAMWHRVAVAVLLGLIVTQVSGAPQIKNGALARITAYGQSVATGTGFFISSGHLVTAYHVVYGARRIDISVGGRTYQDVVVAAVYPQADLALLQVPEFAAGSYYRTVLESGGVAGQQIYIHGMPLGLNNQLLAGRLTQKGYLASEQWADREGVPLFRVRKLDLVPLDITSEAGMSGGPVMDEQGNVFGVFSGSLEVSGRGFSWAVPISYVNLDHMQQLNRRASAIQQWPEFVYLRAGLSLLRSLDRNSQAARLANRCRSRIDEYMGAWETQLAVGNHYAMKWQLMKPHFDDIMEGVRTGGPESQKSKVMFLFTTLEPQMMAFEEAQLRFEQSSAQLVTDCYSQTLFKSLIPKDVPTTRANALFVSKMRDRVFAIVEEREAANEAGKALEEKAQAMMRDLFSMSDVFDSSEDAQLIEGILQVLALMGTSMTTFLSEEQADYIHGLAQGARSWTETIEAMELRQWEREHRRYGYLDPSGISMTLSSGWMRFDGELRDALLGPGKSIPAIVKFIKLGPPMNMTPPLAMATLAWQPGNSTGLAWDPDTSPPSRDESQSSLPWIYTNNFWAGMQNAEGARYTNVERYTNRMGNNLLLEMIGDAKGAAGEQYRVYAGLRFNRGGTSALTCVLLSQAVDYGSCTELQDSMRVPE